MTDPREIIEADKAVMRAQWERLEREMIGGLNAPDHLVRIMRHLFELGWSGGSLVTLSHFVHGNRPQPPTDRSREEAA